MLLYSIRCLICFVILVLLPTNLLFCHPPEGGGGETTATTASTSTSSAGVPPAACACTTCSSASLRTLTFEEAQESGQGTASAVVRPNNTVSHDGAGCTLLTPNCNGTHFALTIHILLPNGAIAYGNYVPGAITLECNSQGKWVVPPNARNAGNEVDAEGCVLNIGPG
ncbi:hypothetical protein niasHT_017260 [Heterodera trifolii]|uniref:C6 domain-containing protein n=1 Tax=Heterodera trifolii TaxID=157864 RepID=A0ABD2LGQ3_9BILA